MAYIAPNTDVYILRRVSLDKDYNHTVRQTSASAQANMFNSSAYKKYTLTTQTYQRAGENKIRVAILADNLYDCNYMMFRNTNFGSKWFYAFITKVTYINNNTTELEYKLDVMQTWYFDYELGNCFVEREHTITDGIGDNLVPEDVDAGALVPVDTWEYYYNESGTGDAHKPMYTALIYYVPGTQYISGVTYSAMGYPTVQTNSVTLEQKGTIVNGIYAGCYTYAVPLDIRETFIPRTDPDVPTITYKKRTTLTMSSCISTVLSYDGNIVNIVQVPTTIYEAWAAEPTQIPRVAVNHAMTAKNYNAPHTDYYVPKNNKMLTFPYKQILVSNNNGKTATYKWEEFNLAYGSLKSSTFYIEGVPLLAPEIMCYPSTYRGMLNDYETGMVLTDFPTPPWNEDSFAKWWAQNGEAFSLSMVSSAVSIAAGVLSSVASGGALTPIASGAVVGGVSLAANSIGQISRAYNTPDQLNGQSNVASLRTAQKRIGFKFYDMGVEMSRARVIDDYFSMYGYAVKQVKLPNIRNAGVTLRPHWNYIKTSSCIIHAASLSGLPADAESEIAKIYDKGITFWNSLAEIGNYTLDNSPT